MLYFQATSSSSQNRKRIRSLLQSAGLNTPSPRSSIRKRRQIVSKDASNSTLKDAPNGLRIIDTSVSRRSFKRFRETAISNKEQISGTYAMANLKVEGVKWCGKRDNLVGFAMAMGEQTNSVYFTTLTSYGGGLFFILDI